MVETTEVSPFFSLMKFFHVDVCFVCVYVCVCVCCVRACCA